MTTVTVTTREPQAHGPTCPVRAGGECTCGEADAQLAAESHAAGLRAKLSTYRMRFMHDGIERTQLFTLADPTQEKAEAHAAAELASQYPDGFALLDVSAYPDEPVYLDAQGQQWRGVGDFGGTGKDEDARTYLALVNPPVFAGCGMHVYAIQVQTDEQMGRDGIRRAINDELEDDLDRLCAMFQTAYQTATIDGREYVIFALPEGA